MPYNSQRLADYLARYELEALVLSSPVNVSYVSDMDCWLYTDFRENMLNPGASNSLAQSYVVATPDSKPIVVVSTGTSPFVPEGQAVEVRTYGDVGLKLPPRKKGENPMWTRFRDAVGTARDTPAEALVSALGELGVRKGRVGVELANVSKATRKHLAKSMERLELLDAAELIRLVRMVKTEEEHARMKKAAEITEQGLMRSAEEAKPGAKFGRMYSSYMTEVMRHEAVGDHYTFSPAGYGISSDPGYVLHSGDATQIDCGVRYGRYCSDTGVSLILGNGRKDAERMYRTLWEIFESCLDTLTPGSTPSYLLKRFKKAYKREGVEGVNYQAHGIGLQAREHPIVAYTENERIADDVVDVDVDIPFEEGMVINIETGLNLYGEASHQVERTFRIGKSKPIEMTPKRDGEALVVKG